MGTGTINSPFKMVPVPIFVRGEGGYGLGMRYGNGAFSLMLGAVLGFVWIASAVPASAQEFDHLKCFRMRDQKTFRAADVDLAALPVQFGLESCEIKGGAKEFCVPVTKTVTNIEDGVVGTLDGDPVSYSRLCYKLKCPRNTLTPETVTDQFGERTIEKFKAFKLCTPAVLASAPVTTTTSTSTTTSTTQTTTTTLSLDDDFNGVALDPSWSILNPGLATISVSGGELHITPTAGGAPDLWFEDGEGVHVYKEVVGDFDVRTVISTEDAGSPGTDPPTAYQLGGILARDPASTSGDRNTVHVALGTGSAGQGVSYEYKSTDGSVSDWMTTPTASRSGELRLTRVGTTVTMYWRANAVDAWTSINSFIRADLPATLEIGPMAYSATDPAGIRANFDSIIFDLP